MMKQILGLAFLQLSSLLAAQTPNKLADNALFFAIGWSKEGLFAYGSSSDAGAGFADAEFSIINAVTDERLFVMAHRAQNSELQAAWQGFWRENGPACEKAMASHKIEKISLEPLAPEFSSGGHSYKASLLKEAGFYAVRLSMGAQSKRICQFKADQALIGAQVRLVFKSPYEERAALVAALAYRGFDDKSATVPLVAGAHLTGGF